jgi:glycosyltransferase involved in cell wall biosynthesis
LKVVIAVHHFPPNHNSGAELRAYRTAAWLRDHECDVRVVCVEHIDRGPDGGVSWEDGTYKGVPVRRLSLNLSKASDRFRWSYDNPWIESHVRDYLAQVEPDIFHMVSGYLFGAGALRAARALGIPAVITLTDYWFLCPHINLLRSDGKPCASPDTFDATACVRCKSEERRRFRIPAKVVPGAVDWFWIHAFESGWGRLCAFSDVADQFKRRNHTLMEALSAADALICPSRFLIEKLVARGIDRHKLILSSHGLDCSSWLPVSDIDEPDHVFRIGYMGQIAPHKGVHLLLEAFAQLRSDSQLELSICGDETVFPRYTRRLRELGRGDRRIKILGRYDYQHVAQILGRMDILVIPSTWNEIGPWVMYEAFQTKTPVVASDIPNMSYVVQHEENGLLFACGESTTLADQLQRLIDSPDLLAWLKGGIGPVKSIAEEMEELQDTYCLVLNPAGGRDVRDSFKD